MKSVSINGARIKVELPKGVKEKDLPERLKCNPKAEDKKLTSMAKEVISFG